MILKNNSSIFEIIDLTWPAEESHELPKWKLRKSIKGGKRVSAATAVRKSGISDIQFVENTLAEWCQDKLFMIKAGQNSLDEELQNVDIVSSILQIFGVFLQNHYLCSKFHQLQLFQYFLRWLSKKNYGRLTVLTPQKLQ